MQEAFDKARQRNPNSPLAPVIRGVHQAQATERFSHTEKKRLAQLREQFKEVGLMWFGTRIDRQTGIFCGYDGIPIEQKRKDWTQALTNLKNRPSEQRTELLNALASGMRLSEDITPADNSKYGRVFLGILLVYESSELPGIQFTRPSIFFMDAISDMSGHSREQKQEFRKFMVEKSGLTGEVGLPELFPGISRWIDHK